MKLYGSLNNYIAPLRKESGLLQDELAVLLGLGGRASVSRYESSVDIPDLAKLIALEIIFDEPIQAIFAGVAEDIREDIRRRAQALLEGMNDKPTAENVQRLTTLDRLAHPNQDNSASWREAA